MIGIYHGYDKPKFANDFLKDFVEGVSKILQEGITFQNKFYSIRIISIICDAPAKSFITYTKGHSGYASCTKCYIEGENRNRRICFPFIANMKLRNEEFQT